MKTYYVIYQAPAELTLTVEAESEADAKRLADERIDDGDYDFGVDGEVFEDDLALLRCEPKDAHIPDTICW